MTANTQHTPGPWKVLHTRARKLQWNVCTENGAPFQAVIVEGLCNSNEHLSDEVQEANARLIAAAPDLLASLIDLLAWANISDDSHYKTLALRNAARAAIRQATGG